MCLCGGGETGRLGRTDPFREGRLRRALGSAGAARAQLITRPPGYLLDVDPQQVDALRFTDRVAAARAAAGSDPRSSARRTQHTHD